MDDLFVEFFGVRSIGLAFFELGRLKQLCSLESSLSMKRSHAHRVRESRALSLVSMRATRTCCSCCACWAFLLSGWRCLTTSLRRRRLVSLQVYCNQSNRSRGMRGMLQPSRQWCMVVAVAAGCRGCSCPSA